MLPPPFLKTRIYGWFLKIIVYFRIMPPNSSTFDLLCRKTFWHLVLTKFRWTWMFFYFFFMRKGFHLFSLLQSKELWGILEIIATCMEMQLLLCCCGSLGSLPEFSFCPFISFWKDLPFLLMSVPCLIFSLVEDGLLGVSWYVHLMLWKYFSTPLLNNIFLQCDPVYAL